MENTSLLLKNTVHNGKTCDVLIENGMFSKIADSVKAPADCRVINCRGNLAVSPAFYNTHTHAAMTLLRSYADDMNLFKWLQEYIWPVEAKLTPHDIYVGSKRGEAKDFNVNVNYTDCDGKNNNRFSQRHLPGRGAVVWCACASVSCDHRRQVL